MRMGLDAEGAGMTDLPAAPAILSIDVAALVDNWRLLARRAAPGDCAAVVKANGYGLGIETVAPPLYAAGCRVFFVAQIGEGKALRALLPQADARIYVLNGLEAKADPLADYSAFRLAPAIGGAAELERWAAFARMQGRPPAAALHLDTGMNRLGFESLDALREAVAAAGDERRRPADEPFCFVGDRPTIRSTRCRSPDSRRRARPCRR